MLVASHLSQADEVFVHVQNLFFHFPCPFLLSVSISTFQFLLFHIPLSRVAMECKCDNKINGPQSESQSLLELHWNLVDCQPGIFSAARYKAGPDEFVVQQSACEMVGCRKH